MSELSPSSMADVAERAGVSVSTVSRALRGSAAVSAETTARVLQAAEELAFAVSRTASSLATGKLNRVAVLVSGSLGAWFNGTLLDTIYATLHEAEHELLIYRTLSTAERDAFFTTLPARRNADAMIVASLELTPSQRQRLHGLGMPLVFVNHRVRGSVSVAIDDAAGAEVATRHLLHLGHRRIAFLRLDHPGVRPSSADRLTGFRRAVEAAGLPATEHPVLSAGANPGPDDLAAAVLSLTTPPTAVVAESDELALSLLGALLRLDIAVPRDLSVVGFDDHAMAARFGLTTIAQPLDALGAEAARIALALAAGSSPRPRSVVVPTRLILRSTTGRPDTRH